MKSTLPSLLIMASLIVAGIILMGGSADALSANFQDQTIVWGQQMVYDLSNDVSGVAGSASYQLGAGPQNLVVTSNGLVGWTPNKLQTGTHAVKVSVSDGMTTVTDSFQILVLSQSPTVNFQDLTATQGQPLTVDLTQYVTSANPTSYALSNGPSGLSVSNSGTLSWTPSSAGISTVEVAVTDTSTTNTVVDSFDIDVQPAPPSNAGMNLSVNEVLIGGPSADRDVSYTEQITLTNTGNQDLSNIQLDLVSNTGSSLPSKYLASAIVGSTSLNAGDSTTIDLDVTIPEDAPVYEQKIGRLEVSADTPQTTLTEYSNINMQAKSMLRIDEVEIEVNGDDDTLSDGDTVDVEVGDEITLLVTLENLYSKSSNIELEDAFFEMDDDGDWDLDYDSDEKDIDEDDDETFEVSFTIPNDMDDDDVDVLIEAFAEDEDYGFEHFDDFEFEFELDRENHEILIDDWSFSRDPVNCDEGYVELYVDLKNTGKNDEDEVTFNTIIDEADYSWHDRKRDLSIDEHDDKRVTVHIPLEKDMPDDVYFVELEVYYDDDDLSDQATAVLDVECDATNGSDGNESDGGDVVIIGGDDDNGSQVPPTPNPTYGDEVSALDDFRSSTGYLVLLIVIGLAFLLAVGYLFHQVALSDR